MSIIKSPMGDVELRQLIATRTVVRFSGCFYTLGLWPGLVSVIPSTGAATERNEFDRLAQYAYTLYMQNYSIESSGSQPFMSGDPNKNCKGAATPAF